MRDITSANLESPVIKDLQRLAEQSKEKDPTLEEIFHFFGEGGHYLLITFMIVPFLQPIPLWGLSTPFGLLIAVVAFFAYKHRAPVIPKRWKDKTIKGQTISKITEAADLVFRKVLFMIYPRMNLFFTGPFRSINTAIIIFNAILLALPLPVPFSNAFPGWVILFQSLAHLEKDGLFILISYIQAILCIAFFGLVILGVESGLTFLLN